MEHTEAPIALEQTTESAPSCRALWAAYCKELNANKSVQTKHFVTTIKDEKIFGSIGYNVDSSRYFGRMFRPTQHTDTPHPNDAPASELYEHLLKGIAIKESDAQRLYERLISKKDQLNALQELMSQEAFECFESAQKSSRGVFKELYNKHWNQWKHETNRNQSLISVLIQADDWNALYSIDHDKKSGSYTGTLHYIPADKTAPYRFIALSLDQAKIYYQQLLHYASQATTESE